MSKELAVITYGNGDILLNKYSAQELFMTPNLWQLVSQHASLARAFMYNQAVTTCKDGAQALSKDWQAAIAQASTRYAARLFPDSAEAKTQLLQYLPHAYLLTQASREFIYVEAIL